LRRFLDTHDLLYAGAADAGSQQPLAAARIAQHPREGSGVVSTQMLHEFVAAAVLEALHMHTLRKISFWDALILQAARQSGCVQVLTEDLQDGATIAGVRVVNPFTADAAAPASQAPRRPRRR
jgi:predicted nucleic acid-binding protein